MLKLSSYSFLVIFLLSGCVQNTATYENNHANNCKNIENPKWLDDEYVGISRITASSNKTEQKQIALQRAIALLVMTKGNTKGSSVVSVQRELKTSNQKELYTKRFKENSSMKINFKDINYDVKIVNIWKDPCSKEIYVKIEEK